jgi:hypothetical protein
LIIYSDDDPYDAEDVSATELPFMTGCTYRCFAGFHRLPYSLQQDEGMAV